MTKLTIKLNAAEKIALSHVCDDPQVWATNFVRNRCQLAIEEIYLQEVERMVADPDITEIPADKESVVLAFGSKDE